MIGEIKNGLTGNPRQTVLDVTNSKLIEQGLFEVGELTTADTGERPVDAFINIF
ncbi:hypothetical protein Enr10x_10250 [Gimesia panareensis]|uniref:Uncharacterized protein n=1 Tax=Gimesia panareensis TaxID=2527978 RepID=A0A517Q285_9PLAN|nr:hypothetical protein Enr10x_10250 [Gimesia panareensis]